MKEAEKLYGDILFVDGMGPATSNCRVMTPRERELEESLRIRNRQLLTAYVLIVALCTVVLIISSIK